MNVTEFGLPPLLLDPSVVLSRPGFAWLADRREFDGIVIPRAFVDLVNQERWTEVASFLRGRPGDTVPDDVRAFASLVRALPTFGIADAPDLPEVARSILIRLRDQPDGAVWADEWAFLMSHSWMVSLNQRAMKAFRNAGAIVVTYGRDVLHVMRDQVVPRDKVPAVLTDDFVMRVAGKWIIVSGLALAADAVAGPIGGKALDVLLHPVEQRILHAIDP